MADLTIPNLAHFDKVDPTGRLRQALQQLIDGQNNMAQQTNASPVGKTEAPPQISQVTAVALAPGVHKVQIQDSNPVNRGIVYHFEFSDSPNFETGRTVLSYTGPSRDHIITLGAGPIFWRGFSQYPTSDPSEPIYANGGVPLNAGGAARLTGITGTGSGTEPSVDSQGGAGFGFTEERQPAIPR